MSWEDIVKNDKPVNSGKKRKPWSIYTGLSIDGKWLRKNFPEIKTVIVEVKHMFPNKKFPISVKWLNESHPEMLEAWKDYKDEEDEKKGLEIKER